MAELILWGGFLGLVLGLLAIDLGIANRRPHAIGGREALVWSAFWIALSMGFAVFLYLKMPATAEHGDPPLEFLAAYTIEKLLSVDNLFVFAVIFAYFKVPLHLQHKVLFWGILSALVMRGVFLLGGLWIVESFEPALYLFGAFLIFTGYRFAREHEGVMDVATHPLLKLLRHLRTTRQFHGESFFVRIDGKRYVTPLFLCLLLIEGADLLFAIDSVPAVVAVSRDSFVIYTSNILAILGLRSLYFVLASALTKFAYLKQMLAVILVFIGAKMVLEGTQLLIIPIHVSLLVVLGLLLAAILLSLAFPPARPGGPSELPARARGSPQGRSPRARQKPARPRARR